MKLLQINATLNITSTGRIAEDIGAVALKKGWESYIAYGREARESDSKTIKIGSTYSIYKHVLITRLFDKHGLGSKAASVALLKKINEIKPDAIGLHNIHGYYINYPLLFEFLKKVNIPVFWTFHDCWPFTGHCAFYEGVNCYRWETECFNCPQKKEYPVSYFIDGSKRNYHLKKITFNGLKNLTIITCSDWLKHQVKKSFLKDYSVVTIHNGVDINIFSPKESQRLKVKYNTANKKIILGIANIWTRRKGLDDFISLSKQIGDDYKIILIGLNNAQIKSLPDDIIGIGRTENIEELVSFYSMADVFVNPTYSDNFPTTNLEALACGTPVITYDTGGSPESINLEIGRVTKKGNISQLIYSIEKICAYDRKILRKKCRDHAVRNFNKQDRFKDYLNLYEKEVLKLISNE